MCVEGEVKWTLALARDNLKFMFVFVFCPGAS